MARLARTTAYKPFSDRKSLLHVVQVMVTYNRRIHANFVNAEDDRLAVIAERIADDLELMNTIVRSLTWEE